jgi:esterase/lipase superfamily enzyme
MLQVLLALAGPAAALDLGGRELPVYYATNRSWHNGPKPGFDHSDAEELAWGRVSVLESELRLPGQDKVLFPHTPERWTSGSVLKTIEARGLPVVIVVHGYNTSWTWAAREAAQLALDLEAAGTPVVPVLFSWPSGGFVRYVSDENAAYRSVARFQSFLADVLQAVPEGQVHIVAHSMGARVVAAAVDEMWDGRAPPDRHLGQIVLASADIDTLEFRERYLGSLLEAGARTTLYVSHRDRALGASRTLHGGYTRLGLYGLENPPAELEVVDTAALDRGYTRHSTFRQSEVALRDLAAVLTGSPASERALVAAGGQWTFTPIGR